MKNRLAKFASEFTDVLSNLIPAFVRKAYLRAVENVPLGYEDARGFHMGTEEPVET